MIIAEDLHIFTEDWVEEASPAPAPSRPGHQRFVVFLSDQDQQERVRHRILQVWPGATVVTVARGPEVRRLGPDRYEVGGHGDEDMIDQHTRLLEAVTAEHGRIDVVAHLWGLAEHGLLGRPDAVVAALKAMTQGGSAPARIILGAAFRDGVQRCLAESWTGFERSIGIVAPGTRLSVLCVDVATDPVPDIPDALVAELCAAEPEGARISGDRRQVLRVRGTDPAAESDDPIRPGGTYLITGGMGGLGRIFGTWLARDYGARLVLIGTRAIGEAVERHLAELTDSGAADAQYLRADVCDAEALRAAVDSAIARYGRVDGVFHAAGLEAPGNITSRDLSTFRRILAPKITGTMNLEAAFSGRPPGFVVYFSSSAAILGDFGSCDYAVGNRFQMSYARHLTETDPTGPKRLAVNWPLWRSQGMSFSDDTAKEFYLRSSGQRLLEPAEGTALMSALLRQPVSQALALAGRTDRIHGILRLAEPQPEQPPAGPTHGTASAERLDQELRAIIGQILRVPPDRLTRDSSLKELGFDSVALVELAGVLGERLNLQVTPDVFFTYTTVAQLHGYLLEKQPPQPAESPAGDAAAASAEPARHRVRRRTVRAVGSRFAGPGRTSPHDDDRQSHRPVAVIGMSGRFAGARTVDELWDLLVQGRSAITPAGPDRDPSWADGKQRRFGQIPGVAEFDPRFFEIPPSEAGQMDPRQRLILEEMWRALENAGCGARRLDTERVGVFVGVEEGDYRLLTGADEGITSNHNAVLAARLSYFLNLTGPSIAINTACSSALVALHEACLSLRTGECDTAIVAGVNILATPREYDALDSAGMLDPDGVSRTFDKRAAGMVPGEAVAVVVLKPRDDAARGGHTIHASILGSGVNNDGRTNGITAPSGRAQATLLDEVYRRAGVSPASLGHIVTHGTGTRLGDPVEINALIEAFRTHPAENASCALTSTKPNVGHSLAASGLVSLIALVLGMHHEIIPPSINCEQLSDFVSWQNSPFYVNREPRAWPDVAGQPRRGAVSAFGFSGTNVHVVLESHDTFRGGLEQLGTRRAGSGHLLLVSAKSDQALHASLRQVADHLEVAPDTGSGLLAAVSHTLMAGRRHFRRRCALVVRDRTEAIEALRAAADGTPRPDTCLGTVAPDFSADPAEATALEKLARASDADDGAVRRLNALARGYCEGHDPELFMRLWAEDTPPLVAIPGYPFDNAEYWVARRTVTPGHPVATAAVAALHPLVHRNISDVTGQRFATTFAGTEPWFGAPGLSVGAHLELARAAVVLGLGTGETPVTLRDVTVHEPAGADGAGCTVRADLQANGADGLGWALFSSGADGEEPYLAVDGLARRASPAAGAPAAFDAATLRQGRISSGGSVPVFDLTGDGNGTEQRFLLDLSALGEGKNLVLAPGHLDACLAVVADRLGWSTGTYAVTAVAEAAFSASAGPARWASVTVRTGTSTCSAGVELATEDGLVTVSLRDLVLRRRQPADVSRGTEAAGAGEGRRSYMHGWTVAECLAWELAEVAGAVLDIPAEQLEAEENLANFGFDSLNITKFAGALSERMALVVTPDVFFGHPTLERLGQYLLTEHAERIRDRYREEPAGPVVAAAAGRRYRSERLTAGAGLPPGPAPDDEAIAIVGMSGRFPAARSVDELWAILAEGRSVVEPVPEDRMPWWRTDGPESADRARSFGALPGVAEFDPLFFEISPRDAALMDPRQRLLLQEMWQALEDAGYGERAIREERIGVFVGVEEGDYRYLADVDAGVTSNSNAVLAGRLSYLLNLSGPSMAINTACSSGLVALHQACLSLRYGDCDTAIVAGASVMASAHDYVVMEKATMLSPDRTCYAFDQRANGLVPGEAVTAVVLKRRGRAERHGNPIHATILGSGVNYDGRTSGITAPSGDAQAHLLRSVHDRFRIAPDSLDYVVCHGTGTRLGDPVEVNALADAFRAGTDRTGFCALTSIKPNIGHSMAASGLVNLVALVLAMRHETIPPSINCSEPSDYIDWGKSPFFVNRAARPWPAMGAVPRRGAVSAFGMSGTNAHVVLEAGPDPHRPGSDNPYHLLVISAKSPEALDRRLSELATFLERQDDPSLLASVSRTLIDGRHHFAHRNAMVVRDVPDAVRLLREATAGGKTPGLFRATVHRDFAPNSTVERSITELARTAAALRHDFGSYREHLTALAEFYCQGYVPQSRELWPDPPPMASVPSYPFEAEHYWVPVPRRADRSHPLVREHIKDNSGHRFTTRFTGGEEFLDELLVPAPTAPQAAG